MRLERCRRCRRMFVAAPGERVCRECRRAEDPRRAWGRAGRRGLDGAWRPLALACGGGLAAGLAVGLVAPAWAHLATWAGFLAGMAYAARA